MKKKTVLKVTSIVTALALSAVGLAACGSSSSDSGKSDSSNSASNSAASTTSTTGNTNSSGGKKKIAIMMHSVADEFIYSCGNKAKEYAKEQGYDVTFLDANNDADKQASQVKDVISSKVDGIVLAPVDADALSDSVKEINDANIPVTLIDRTINEGKYVALNQADNTKCGYDGAVQIVEQAKEQGIDVKDLKVLELQGALSSTSGRERSEGFQKGAKDKGFKIVSSLPTEWESDKAYNATLDALQADPDINAIYCASDGVMADSVINALDQVQKLKKRGEKGHVIVVTVDGTPAVIKYIKEGQIDACASQPAFQMGQDAVDYLTKAIDGKEKIDACIDNSLAPTIITKDNADSKDLWGNSVKK